MISWSRFGDTIIVTPIIITIAATAIPSNRTINHHFLFHEIFNSLLAARDCCKSDYDLQTMIFLAQMSIFFLCNYPMSKKLPSPFKRALSTQNLHDYLT
jgi:hypothetical protein